MNCFDGNASINLTAVTDDNEIIHKHFLDSLSILEYITLRDGDAVIDVGTGAGFPGVVLKIYVPGIRLTLIEASQKKASFLKFLIPQFAVASNSERRSTRRTCRSLCTTANTCWGIRLGLYSLCCYYRGFGGLLPAFAKREW